MLQTHFVKKPLKNKKFDTMIHSVFYNALPEGKLLTHHDLINLIRNIKESPFKNERSIEDMLKTMIKDDFIKECNGFFLERVLDIK